jgi:hypothetical protein
MMDSNVQKYSLSFAYMGLLHIPTVEYQTSPSMLWHPCHYERSVVENLLQTQFYDYVERVRTTDCQATLRRLLAGGPPIYIHDKHAMPLPEGESHICAIWFADTNIEQSSQLVGAVIGEERERLWTELKSFIVVEGKETGDDDEDEDDNNDDVVNNGGGGTSSGSSTTIH